MASPLLETKLHAPRRRRSLVPRPRLSARLDDSSEAVLVLLSAPAGFGKTTLLTEWLEVKGSAERLAGWLSLDDRDNDPVLFWRYVVAALQTAGGGIGASALTSLSSFPASVEPALTALLNDLADHPQDIVLVLDDYHAIESIQIHEQLTYLLEHLPPQAHVVIAGRVDPPLPLARLRARGELLEIRAADLRFTPDEAATYLNDAMGLRLTTGDIATLDERTEGWIAALQLAALSMQGRDDAGTFIHSFAGDDRYVVDYLVGEVLEQQPRAVRDFLLQTSILGRLTASLCDAVVDGAGGNETLERLERGNLFLVPLDDRREWFRYHHLFAEVLRRRLLDEQPELANGLHQRASRWFEARGSRTEAIEHALSGADFERAADLIELAAPPLRQARQEATLRRWLDALPGHLFASRPVLSAILVGARMASGDVEDVERYLQHAERWLGMDGSIADGTSASMVVVDEEEFGRLPSQIAVYRAGQARSRGDVTGTIEHARHALALAPQDAHLARGGAAGMLGLSYWTLGDLDAAHHWYSDAASSLRKAGHISDVLGCTLALADIRIAQGRLREALSTYEHGLTVASGGGGLPRGTADMHVGMSEVLLERGDLDAAVDHLRTSQELGEHAALPQNPYRWRVAMARVRRAEGELAAAHALLDDAERLFDGDYFPDVRPVAALRARVQLAEGDVGAALHWVDEHGVAVDDELSYLREFEHITLAKVLMASHTQTANAPLEEAAGLLRRLLDAAEQGGRTGSVIEILVLQAIIHEIRADRSSALASLERALLLAETEGYVRVFVDKGARITALLRAVPRRAAAHGHAQRLLRGSAQAAASATRRTLTEPLSDRELEVLRLLRTDLSGPEIARELSVSLNTVRTHTKHIYAKLGVNNRRAAIRRATGLEL